MYIKLTTIIFLAALQSVALYAQRNDMEFNSSTDYLQYVNKNFKIPSTEIFYISTESDLLNGTLEKYGILLFITDNNISTIQEVAEILKSKCSPKHLLPRVTSDAILKASSPSKVFEKIIIKNLENGQPLSREGNKFAIYVFSYKFGKNAILYFNDHEDLEKMGYKTVVLSIDGAYIKGLSDIDKTPVIVK